MNLNHSPVSIATDALVLLADLQAGIADLPLTVSRQHLGRGLEALLDLAAIFDLPLIVSTVPAQDGEAPKLLPEVASRLRESKIFVRTTPNSMNDAAIRQAIRAVRRKVILVSGVATEVAVQLPCLSAAAEGFDVRVIVDACGGISPRTEDAALRRMTAAGVQTSSIPTLIGELAGDFSQPKAQAAIGVLFKLAGG